MPRDFIQLTKVYGDYDAPEGGGPGQWTYKRVPVWVGWRGLTNCYLERHPDGDRTEIIGDRWSMTVLETPQQIMDLRGT